MSPRSGIKWRYANETMHSGFRAEESVSVLSANLDDCALDAGFLTFALVEQLELEAASLRPPCVHPEQHRCPVLRLSPAGTGGDLHLRCAPVVFAGHECLELESIDLRIQRFDHVVELLLHVGVGRFSEQLVEL